MPSHFAESLIAMVGPVDGYYHIDPVALDTPTKLGAKFASVSKYEPWSHKPTSDMYLRHPVAVWRHLKATISSREGSHGRMVTLYCGWANEGAKAPEIVQEMAMLKGHLSRTFGGTGDPGMFTVTIDCPFDGTMSDVGKMPYNDGARAVFYYCFTEVDLTSSPPDAMRALIEFDGRYDVYGRF